MKNLDKPTVQLNLPPEWKIDSQGIRAIRTMNKSLGKIGKQGIVSTIPIICRGESCPYIDTCPMVDLGTNVDMLRGQRCPVEISKIVDKFEEYVRHFNIDLEQVDPIKLGLIKELIDYDIQIERADKIMSKEGDFLDDVVIGVDSNGRPIKTKEVAKSIEYKERALSKKHQILQLLNSTPKDKAGQKIQITMDPSTYASQLMARAQELEENGVIDVEEYEMVDSTE